MARAAAIPFTAPSLRSGLRLRASLLGLLTILAASCLGSPMAPTGEAPEETTLPAVSPAASVSPLLEAPSTPALSLTQRPPPRALASPAPLSPTPTAARGGPDAAREAVVGGRVFRLEIALTHEERLRGLMGRTSLPQDAGMLFVYDQEDYLVFWMKDTLIPLDILFLNGDSVVVDVQTMEPQPGVPDALLRRYRSARPAQYALEMNAGLAEAHGIVAGMRVEFR